MLSHGCLLILLHVFVESTSFSAENNFAEESSLCAENSIIDINNLGFKLLNKSVIHPGNLFLSPVGAAWSLGILYLVSANQTAHQIYKLLSRSDEIKLSPTKVEEEFTDLLQNLRESENSFGTANQVLLKSHYNVRDEFKNALERNNLAELKVANFSKSNISDADTSNETENITTTVLPETFEDPSVEVVNLVAFNDSWKVQFVPEKTERDYFYSGKRETTAVWMMSMEAETFKFYEDLEMKYKFIELPYDNGYRSMILALPTQYDQPANLQLDTKSYCKIKAKMIPTKLDMVSIPRFQFDEEISIKELLISMGLEDIFNQTTAEFPGISEEDVYVSDIKQLISVEVDEDGGESASITKLNFKPVAFRGVKEFIANHPFLFYVEDSVTGTIVLTGRIDEPSESISFSERLHF